MFHTIKKKCGISFILFLTMMLTLVPSALAANVEEVDLWVGNTRVTSANASNLLEDSEEATVTFDGNEIMDETILELKLKRGDTVFNKIMDMPDEEAFYKIWPNPIVSGDKFYKVDDYYYDKNGEKLFDFDTPISGDLTVYANWEKTTAINSVEFSIDIPKAGTHVTAVNGADTQNPNPVVELYDDANYILCDDIEDLVFHSCWCKDASGDVLFSGDMKAGETYYAIIWLITDEAYSFIDNPKVIINNGKLDGKIAFAYDNSLMCVIIPITIPIEKTDGSFSNVDDWAKEEMEKAINAGIVPETFVSIDATKAISRKDFCAVAVKLYEILTGRKAEKNTSNPFNDTNGDYVLKAYAIGITKGVSSTEFGDGTITREQMATMMTRTLTKAGIDTKIYLEKMAKFSDDSEMHDWGKASVYYMASKEIIKGVGENKFNPLGEAKVEEALAIALRCVGTDLKLQTNDNEIIDAVVENFMLLTKVPRSSHHEEKISNYLMEWAKNEGLKPVQDSVFNVMFDVPATKGMENRPLGILQGHMDMVVAVADDKIFDLLNDTITVIRNDDKGTLTADGTSLGGDDGIGLAIIMAVTQGKLEHGPLRIIITVDEEDGMIGAINIDKSWFDGASYLINIDNEWSTQVLVSTASGNNIRGKKEIKFNDSINTKAIKLEISNLKGGHSGVEIDKGRLNGLICLANFLKQLDEAKVFFELASLEGGTAQNAIPSKANAVLVIEPKDEELIKQKIEEYVAMLNTKYAGIEDEIKFTITEVQNVPQVVSKEERNNVIKFITQIIDGVYTMSDDMEGLVESSSNLGIFKLNSEGISFTSSIRSSSAGKQNEIIETQIALANECGYKVENEKFADPWQFDPNSNLLKLAKKVYLEQNGEEIEVVAVHAGLECGTFKVLKPELDMISIGPDITDAHTINETIYLKSIPKVWRLLEGILSEFK